MIIRNMTIQDYEGIYQLWITTPGMGLNDLDDSKEGIEKYLHRNPTTCFIAIENEKIIGIIMSGHDGRRGYIYHTAVAIEYRNHGIATTLVEYALEALKDENINKVALVAFEDNEVGNDFWEKQGFIERTDLIYRNKNIKEMDRIDI